METTIYGLGVWGLRTFWGAVDLRPGSEILGLQALQ